MPNPKPNPKPNSAAARHALTSAAAKLLSPLTLTQLPQLLYPCSHSYCQTRRLLLTRNPTLTLTLNLNATLTGLSDANAGALFAIATVKGTPSAEVQIATVTQSQPSITSSTKNVARSRAGNRIEVAGSRFGTNTKKLSVSTTPAVAVTVWACTDTSLILDLADSSTLALGALLAVVTHSSAGSSGSVQIGTISAAIATPGVTPDLSSIDGSATAITLSGMNFGSSVADTKIYLEGHPLITGSVSAVSPSSLTFGVSGMSDSNAGVLHAVVAVTGVQSEWVPIALIAAAAPIAHHARFKVARSQSGNVFEIRGDQFGADCLDITISLVSSDAGSAAFSFPNDVNKPFRCTDSLLVIHV